MASSLSTSIPDVRIVVVGDVKMGKTSLIHAAANPEIWAGEYLPELPDVLPATILSEYMFPDRVPVNVIDTCCSDHERTDRELQMAKAVVIVYDIYSLRHLSTRWLHRLRGLRVNVPVILARVMLDPETEDEGIFPLMNEFPEVECCIGFSPFIHDQAATVFRVAQRLVLHPFGPLYDGKTHQMKPRCAWALKRIFILSDYDRDGVLNDEEFRALQHKCFDCPLDMSVVRYCRKEFDEAFNEKGHLTLKGFLILNKLLIEQGHTRMIWAMFRKFGYSDDEWWLPSIIRNSDQSVELTSEAVRFLRGVFSLADRDRVCATLYSLLEPLGIMDSNCGSEAPHDNGAEDDFVAQWALLTLLNPVLSVENLICLGYAYDPSSAVSVTRGRSVDRKKGRSDRKVFQCFVFGPKEAGKSSLLQSFVGSPFSKTYTPTTEERCTTKIVDRPFLRQNPLLGSFLEGGLRQKTLILREIPEDAIENLLLRRDALAACDVAVFVYDSSDESSWLRAKGLLVRVASYAESTGYEVPCLIVAAKGDLEPYPTAIQDSTKASRYMRIEAPIRISTKLGDLNNVFREIVRAAEHPDESIPKLKAESPKLYLRTLGLSMMIVSAAVVVATSFADAIASKKASSPNAPSPLLRTTD